MIPISFILHYGCVSFSMDWLLPLSRLLGSNLKSKCNLSLSHVVAWGRYLSKGFRWYFSFFFLWVGVNEEKLRKTKHKWVHKTIAMFGLPINVFLSSKICLSQKKNSNTLSQSPYLQLFYKSNMHYTICHGIPVFGYRSLIPFWCTTPVSTQNIFVKFLS